MCENKKNTIEQASSLSSKGIKEFRTYKRNLPHWEMPGSVYFITFKTAPGLILPDSAKDIVFESVSFHKDKKYKLYAMVIMPDHVRLILQPLKKSEDNFYSLAEIMHSLKSYSAKQINKVLNKSGSVWLDENFDRIVRDDQELDEKVNYILNNPLKTGLGDSYKWVFV